MGDSRHYHGLKIQLQDVRSQVIGTLSLLVLLLVVFQVETVAVQVSREESIPAFFNAQSNTVKIAIAALLGPFIHQNAEHLVGNLSVLLLVGSYLESVLGRRTVYLHFAVIGYVATWVPLINGFGGAVGASGATYGMSAAIIVVGAWVVITDLYSRSVRVSTPLHLLPVLFGFAQIVSLASTRIQDAGDLTHVFGALIGLLVATTVVVDRSTGVWSGLYRYVERLVPGRRGP